MPDRSKTVAMLLTSARSIVLSEEFARDARRYARIARDLEDLDAADVLDAMVRAREADIVVIRKVMTRLASDLAEMAIEAE